MSDIEDTALDGIPTEPVIIPQIVEEEREPLSETKEEELKRLEKAQIESMRKCIDEESVNENRRALHDEVTMWTFLCPHCNQFTEVLKNQVNCQIFRHATFMTGQPINPHLPQALCEQLIQQGQVYGCAKPFRLRFTPEGNYAEICDYI
jgi:hypothetical protein